MRNIIHSHVQAFKKGVKRMVEEWVTFLLCGRDSLVCEKCSGAISNQKVYMYLNVDHEIEEVVCAKCYKSERK